MNKLTLIPVVIGLCVPVVSLAETTFFGRIQASYAFESVSGEEDGQELNTEGTRLGLKGFSAMNERSDITYMLEADVSLDEGDFFEDTRQGWIGLRGELGELRLGRQLGATQVSSEWVDMFPDQLGDYNHVLETEISHDESVAYINKFGDFGFAAEISTDDELSPDTKKVTGTDIMLNYYKDGWYAAVGNLKADGAFKSTRLSGAYTFKAGHKVGLTIEETDFNNAGGHRAALLSGRYQSGDLTFKAQVGYNEPDEGGEDETLVAVGVDYSLNPSTSLTSQYVVNQHRDHTADDEMKTFAVGILYQF